MKAKEYSVLELAIEDGVTYGYNRAFKYEPDPSPENIKDAIKAAVMNSICEWFYFDESGASE